MNWSITREFATAFASEWIEAWNARDLDRILKHYAREVELTSPFVCRMLGRNENTIRGTAVLRLYFSRALNAYPDLHFIQRRVYFGAQSLVVEYESVEGRLAAEMMEFDEAGIIVRVRAHYAATDVWPGK